MDPRCPPERIGPADFADQVAHRAIDGRAARTGSGPPAPVAAETVPMPLDDRSRPDQDYGAQAARPEPIKPDPEEAIDREEPRTAAPLALENGQLMAQGDDLQLQGGEAAKPKAEQ